MATENGASESGIQTSQARLTYPPVPVEADQTFYPSIVFGQTQIFQKSP